MSKISPVTICFGDQEKTYSVKFQTDEEYKIGWKSALKRVHGKGEGICKCEGRGAKRLAIRYYEESDSFGLAKFPLSGEEHAQDCIYYSPNPVKSGEGGYATGVIDERPDGSLRIRLGIGLRIKDPIETEPPTSTTPRRPGTRQAAMKLLGVLHLLWTQAGLNRWWPAMEGKRDSNLVQWRLRQTATSITASRLKISRSLLLPAAYANSARAKENTEIVAGASKESRRLLVVASLAKYSAERADEIRQALPITEFHGIPRLKMSDEIWTSAQKRFPLAVSAWEAGLRTIAICQVELIGNAKTALVLDIALMQVTKSWIPVESSYENIIAEKLTNEDRAFIKPLRFDSDESVVFPDFILLDTLDDTPLEVFGRSDEKYVNRKNEKIAYYQENFGIGKWWCWNAAVDPQAQQIEPFPQPKRK